jgi:tetratricopeptide (TPR) repeat protein
LKRFNCYYRAGGQTGCGRSVDHGGQDRPEFCDGASRISLPPVLACTLALWLVVLGSMGLQAQSISKRIASERPEVQQSYSAGLDLVRQGHLDAAIQSFEKGLEADKQNLILLDAIGATYSLKGDLERSQKYFLESLQADPSFIPARKNLAITYFSAGQYKLAVPEFLRLISGPGDSRSIAHLFLGIIAEKQEEYAKSAALLEKSGALLYQYPQALISFTTSLYKLQRLQRAKAVLGRLDSMSGVTPSEYFKLGLLHSQLGQDKLALACFDKAGQEKTEVDGLEYQRAIVLDRLGRSQEALKILKDLVSAKPDADSLNLLAHVAEENREFEVALQSLRLAAKLEPAREDNYLDFSTFCADYENYPLALEAADIGLEHVPNSYRLQVQKGVVLEKLGRLDQAEEVLQKASRLQRDNSVALLSLAIVQTHAGALQSAVSTLSAAISKFPNNYYMHYHLGTVLARLGERDRADDEIEVKAEQAFREAIRLNPSFADSYYQLSKLYSRHAPKLAEQNLVACLRMDPNHASAEYALGRLYLKTGRRAEGQKLLDQFESQQQAEKLKEQSKPRIEAAQR